MSVVDKGISFGVLTSGFVQAPGVLALFGVNVSTPATNPCLLQGNFGSVLFASVAYTLKNSGYSTLSYSVTSNPLYVAIVGTPSGTLAAGSTFSFQVKPALPLAAPGRYATTLNAANLTDGLGSVSVPVELVVTPSEPSPQYLGIVPLGLHFVWDDDSFLNYTITGFEVEYSENLPLLGWREYGTLPPNYNAVAIDYGIAPGASWWFRIRSFITGTGDKVYSDWTEISGTA